MFKDRHPSAAKGLKGQFFPTQRPLAHKISRQITTEHAIKYQWLRRQASLPSRRPHQPNSLFARVDILLACARPAGAIDPCTTFSGGARQAVSNSIISGVGRLLAPPHPPPPTKKSNFTPIKRRNNGIGNPALQTLLVLPAAPLIKHNEVGHKLSVMIRMYSIPHHPPR